MTLSFDPMKSDFLMLTGVNQLNFHNEIAALRKIVWPDFIRLQDDIIFKIYELYPEYQISLFDRDTNKLIGIANGIPIRWGKSFNELPDDGLSWILETKNINDLISENTLCAISITVDNNYRNRGISRILLNHLKTLCRDKSLENLIVPVRPTMKRDYPLIPLEEYILWKNKDGFAFDPWLRIHILLGAKIIKICNRSAQIIASIKQWEDWTGLTFPGDGLFLVKDALNPIKIDHVANQGIYFEPNIWVHYQI